MVEPQESFDYDLHGLARVRLMGATDADRASVDRQLGPLRAPVVGDADIVIRFVERLSTHGREWRLGAGDAAFTDHDFVILRTRYRAQARVAVAFDRIADGFEFVCEHGLPSVPYLIPVLNLTVLAKGVLPLHGAAFVYHGTGAVVTGWSKGGKTESLLAFASRGARYVGDEWIYLPPGGDRVLGVPEPVRLWDWHLAQLPSARAKAGTVAMTRLATVRLAAQVGWRTRAVLPNGSALGRVADRFLPLLDNQRHVDLDPGRLFGAAEIPEGPFDLLFFVVSGTAPDIRARSIDPHLVADRMIHSLQYERLDFMAAYRRFRFAFPGARSAIIEEAETRERELIQRLFAGKPTVLVEHPYPVSLAGLHEAMAAFFP